MICTGLPVVSCPYMPAAEIPMPCWPRLMRSRWNLDPYRSFANIGGICWRMMPGPLSAASLTQVSSAFRGLSNPRRCRFLVKNSETEMSRWRAPISTADTAGFGGGGVGCVLGDFRIPPIQTESEAGTQVFPSGASGAGLDQLPDFAVFEQRRV